MCVLLKSIVPKCVLEQAEIKVDWTAFQPTVPYSPSLKEGIPTSAAKETATGSHMNEPCHLWHGTPLTHKHTEKVHGQNLSLPKRQAHN